MVPPSELDDLLRRLADDDPVSRCAAAAELGRRHCRDGTAVAALTAALDDADPRVVVAATRALRRAVGRWRTDQLVAAHPRRFVATEKLVHAVERLGDAPPPAPSANGRPVPSRAVAPTPPPQRPAVGVVRAAVRRFDVVARRGWAGLARRLGPPAGPRALEALVAGTFYLLAGLAVAAVGRWHFLFVRHLFAAPAYALGGAAATAALLAVVLAAALVRALDRPRGGAWPALAVLALL